LLCFAGRPDLSTLPGVVRQCEELAVHRDPGWRVLIGRFGHPRVADRPINSAQIIRFGVTSGDRPADQVEDGQGTGVARWLGVHPSASSLPTSSNGRVRTQTDPKGRHQGAILGAIGGRCRATQADAPRQFVQLNALQSDARRRTATHRRCLLNLIAAAVALP